ncbi:neurogenic locus notch homolog protein 1-like isoform X1 [Asterias rubens]|uniref:neurogenic locus notch homolog protein 1-like isoform X1 n=1 Tax=Asterias rubens TaxID=7604 RepID=UPI001454EB24|nr:neurogenic locus notch homolog protein 1-like isoform X1 [Asterias rubens]
MHIYTFLAVFGFFAFVCQGADIGALRARYNAQKWRHNYPSTSRVAFCRYGQYRRRECCYGWRYQSTSQCAPICEDGCIHGKCVGPNRCECDKGWTGATCDRDYNECSTKPCSHRCVNNVGSFRCFCPTGHLLQEDKVTCVWDYRCHPDRCAYGCEQVGYQFRCLCPDGLKVSKNGFHCEDIDECSEGLIKCPSDQRCHNTYGNYMCMCKEGFAFQLINRRLICKERDLCVAQGLFCDENAHCEEGGVQAKCVCNEGYVGDGITCRTVAKRTCADRPCFPGVVCTNIRLNLDEIDLNSGAPIKLFRCGPCPLGYTGDGVRCRDINECLTGNYECHQNATCINTVGSYECQCNQGFVGDGKRCVPIDRTVCADTPCFDGVRCFDIPLNLNNIDLDSATIVKLYRCGSCPAGFEGDGKTCTDKNECEDNRQRCNINADCINTPGSYKCKCKEGFAGDGLVCVPLDPRTCAEQPCFIGVDCEDIPLQRILNSPNWRQLDVIELFRCGNCPTGYQGDGDTCADINECVRGLDNCHADATCINTPGSYRCVCNDGFAGNGVLCVPVDPRTCADQPCFGGRVQCQDLQLGVVVRNTDLATATLIKLFRCGACPAGYYGNGEVCQDIDECALNLFECHERATCVNTDGGYECICDPGYAGDGKRCREIDPTRCADRPCFDGVLCTDLPLVIDTLDLDITDVIKLYKCGTCPPGYRGDGEICIDIDECLEGLFFCVENSTCQNLPGTYDCVCNEGFFGDGVTCVPLDPRTCADQPCFEGVECTVVDPYTLEWKTMEIVRRFACGDCPEGFTGDGEVCKKIPPLIVIPDNVTMTVVVIDPTPLSQDRSLVPDATVTAYVADESTGTQRYASATTNYSGFTKLAVPHNESVVITVSHDNFLTKSQTFKAHLVKNNTLTVEVFKFSELTEFLWTPATSRALEFGDLLRLEIPKGGLAVRSGERVTIECRPLNMSLIQGPSEGPELIAGIRNDATGEIELTGIEVFGMTELKCLVPKRSRQNPTKKISKPARDTQPFTISMPVIDLVDDPETPLYAWRYHDEKGYWVLEGEISGVTGTTGDESAPAIANDEQVTRLMWQYFARNFTYSWWAFGKAWDASSCVTARVCYDLACRFPVDNALIELYGVDFRYTVSRYTGVDGIVSFQYKTGGQIVLRAPCIKKQIEVPFSAQYRPSTCPAGGDEGILTPRKGVAVDTALVTFIFTDDSTPDRISRETCGHPGEVPGAQIFGDNFSHGNEVIYQCDDPDAFLQSSTRVCLKCGEWSGDTPSCFDSGVSDFYSFR